MLTANQNIWLHCESMKWEEDVDGNVIYLGYVNSKHANVADGAVAQWRVAKITYAGQVRTLGWKRLTNGTISENEIWDNRAGLAYT